MALSSVWRLLLPSLPYKRRSSLDMRSPELGLVLTQLEDVIKRGLFAFQRTACYLRE